MLVLSSYILILTIISTGINCSLSSRPFSSDTSIAFTSHKTHTIKSQPATIITKNKNEEEIDLGTTILAIKYKDGIIVASDRRTSISGYVSNRFANKLSFVIEDDHENIHNNDDKRKRISTCCVCRAGSAADTQYIIDTTRELLLERNMFTNYNINSIKNVAYILRYVLKTLSKSRNISSTFICTGYDAIQNKSILYTINSCGTLLEHNDNNWVAFGSGSSYIMGYLEEFCGGSSTTENMGEEKVIEIVRRALELAIDNDGKSGSGWLCYALDQYGKRRIVL